MTLYRQHRKEYEGMRVVLTYSALHFLSGYSGEWYGYSKANASFITVWIFAYAYNNSHGRNVNREQSISVHYPKCGKYVKLFWRFYLKTNFNGYLTS